MSALSVGHKTNSGFSSYFCLCFACHQTQDSEARRHRGGWGGDPPYEDGGGTPGLPSRSVPQGSG